MSNMPISYELLASTFHLPVFEASSRLGVPPKILYQLARDNGHECWPSEKPSRSSGRRQFAPNHVIFSAQSRATGVQLNRPIAPPVGGQVLAPNGPVLSGMDQTRRSAENSANAFLNGRMNPNVLHANLQGLHSNQGQHPPEGGLVSSRKQVNVSSGNNSNHGCLNNSSEQFALNPIGKETVRNPDTCGHTPQQDVMTSQSEAIQLDQVLKAQNTANGGLSERERIKKQLHDSNVYSYSDAYEKRLCTGLQSGQTSSAAGNIHPVKQNMINDHKNDEVFVQGAPATCTVGSHQEYDKLNRNNAGNAGGVGYNAIPSATSLHLAQENLLSGMEDLEGAAIRMGTVIGSSKGGLGVITSNSKNKKKKKVLNKSSGSTFRTRPLWPNRLPPTAALKAFELLGTSNSDSKDWSTLLAVFGNDMPDSWLSGDSTEDRMVSTDV